MKLTLKSPTLTVETYRTSMVFDAHRIILDHLKKMDRAVLAGYEIRNYFIKFGSALPKTKPNAQMKGKK